LINKEINPQVGFFAKLIFGAKGTSSSRIYKFLAAL